MSTLSASIKRIVSKTTQKRWRHHYKSMGAFLLPWKPEFWSNLPQTLCSLCSTPVMLHIKFDQDWPTGFRIFKFENVDNGWRTIGILKAHLVSLWLRWAKYRQTLWKTVHPAVNDHKSITFTIFTWPFPHLPITRMRNRDQYRMSIRGVSGLALEESKMHTVSRI